MPLWENLRLLANDEAGAQPRERAAGALYRELRRFAKSVIRRRAHDVPEPVIEEAIHKVVLEASLGHARFRGEDERSARAWCNRILQRYAIDYFRGQRHQVPEEDAPELRASADDDPLLIADIESLLDQLVATLPRLHRARDLAAVVQNLKIHLEARLMGRSLDEQVIDYIPSDATKGEEGERKARDRVYQWRRRGKLAACNALASLLESGELNATDGDLLGRLIGCDEESEKESDEVA